MTALRLCSFILNVQGHILCEIEDCGGGMSHVNMRQYSKLYRVVLGHCTKTLSL